MGIRFGFIFILVRFSFWELSNHNSVALLTITPFLRKKKDSNHGHFLIGSQQQQQQQQQQYYWKQNELFSNRRTTNEERNDGNKYTNILSDDAFIDQQVHNNDNNNNGGYYLGISNDSIPPSSSSSSSIGVLASTSDDSNTIEEGSANTVSPFPTMPSPTLLSLVKSQFELLANSIVDSSTGKKKIKSMALYLPQENTRTGQLEFLPAAVFPCPSTERVFIAPDADSGIAPQIPHTLTKLPGFTNAQSLIPAYPFATAAGAVEEVKLDDGGGKTNDHDPKKKKKIKDFLLSSPLFSGSRTCGVLLIWPQTNDDNNDNNDNDNDDDGQNSSSFWTKDDKVQVSLAANSLALALSMDQERSISQAHTQDYAVALADNLHQLKNPLQAMRTFAKLMQRKVVMDLNDELDQPNLYNSTTMSSNMPNYATSNKYDNNRKARPSSTISTPQLVALAENMIVQSERVLDLLQPMDLIVDSMEQEQKLLKGSTSSDYSQDNGRKRGKYILAPSPTVDDESLSKRSDKDNNLYSIKSRPKNNQKGLLLNQRNQQIYTKSQRSNPRNNSSSLLIPVSSKKRRTGKSATFNSKPNRKSPTISGSTTSNDINVKTPVNLQMSFIQDILEPIMASFQILASEKNIQFEVYGLDNFNLPGVTVCPKGLKEAISNMLDNAIKYVPLKDKHDSIVQKPCIKVIITRNEEPLAPGVTIRIHDNGPGIPRDERESVFLRGYRGSNTKSLSKGSGIGLDISKALVTSMGGTLEIVDHEQISNDLGTYNFLKDIVFDSSMNHGATMQLVLFRDIKRQV